MIYLYCRVSTRNQKLDRQIENGLREYPTAKVYKEKYTGTKLEERKELQNLLKVVKPKDTIVFDSVSRMSRDAESGFKLYKELFEKGVELVFLKEPHINTETYKKTLTSQIQLTGTNADIILKAVNEYLLVLAEEQIKIAFNQAQKEVDDIHQRVAEGVRIAQANGKKVGIEKGRTLTTKKSIECKEKIKKHNIDFGGSLNDLETIQLLGIARGTYYKYKRELKAE